MLLENKKMFKLPVLEWQRCLDGNGLYSLSFGNVEYVLRQNPEATQNHPFIVTYDGKVKEFSSAYSALRWVVDIHIPSVAADLGFLVADEADALDYLVQACHNQAYEMGWWTDLETGEPKERNVGEALMLIVSEVAEGMEGHRKNLMDDHLPQYPMLTVELGDAITRICDLAGGLRLSLGKAFKDKLRYNRTRADHQIENRRKEGGKAY